DLTTGLGFDQIVPELVLPLVDFSTCHHWTLNLTSSLMTAADFLRFTNQLKLTLKLLVTSLLLFVQRTVLAGFVVLGLCDNVLKRRNKFLDAHGPLFLGHNLNLSFPNLNVGSLVCGERDRGTGDQVRDGTVNPNLLAVARFPFFIAGNEAKAHSRDVPAPHQLKDIVTQRGVGQVDLNFLAVVGLAHSQRSR